MYSHKSIKHILPVILGCVYLLACFFCLIILVKPGAAIFYKKSMMNPQEIAKTGSDFSYQFTITNPIYDPRTIKVFENQQELNLSKIEIVDTPQGLQATIVFKTVAPANPFSSDYIYRLYIRPYFISSNWGGRGLFILFIGLFFFLVTHITHPKVQHTLGKSIFGSVLLKIYSSFNSIGKKKVPHQMEIFVNSAIYTVLIALLYVFMEWLFLVTKPSYMDILGLSEKVKILVISGVLVSFLALLCLLLMVLFDSIITPFRPAFRAYAYAIPGVLLAASLCLILLDNFTYTIFSFGIVDTKTIIRLLYGLSFVGIFIYFIMKATADNKQLLSVRPHPLKTVFVISFILMPIILFFINYSTARDPKSQNETGVGEINTPNIILLGSDGLNAEFMSVYGYDQDNTPFMKELAKTSLVSANNFTNANKSTGSITSLLTGKLPFTTHVFFPPDILRGIDMYQHLPGILKRYGYRTITIGEEYYIDANAVNFQNAFDAVNCVDNPSNRFMGYGYDDEVYFLNTIAERIFKRIRHIFFIEDMQNPYDAVMHTDSGSFKDGDRITCLRTYLGESIQSKQPLFAHVHMMATHGDFLNPDQQTSNDQNTEQQTPIEVYEEKILGFDIQVDQLVRYLKEQNQFDNTIFILYTDHGTGWTSAERIPLIMHFPLGQYSGTILENTQNLDISPTILDYLGIQKPDWMEGSSLLQELEPNRLILAAIKDGNDIPQSNEFTTKQESETPAYQISDISIIQCQNWYLYNIHEMVLTRGMVENYINPCSPASLYTEELVRNEFISLLEQLGYDVPDKW